MLDKASVLVATFHKKLQFFLPVFEDFVLGALASDFLAESRRKDARNDPKKDHVHSSYA